MPNQTWKEKSGDLLYTDVDDTAFFLLIDETRSPLSQHPVRVTKTNFIAGLNTELDFVSGTDMVSTFTLTPNVADLDPNFNNRYNGFQIYVATQDINLSTPVNSPDGARCVLVIIASLADRTVNFINGSRLTKEGGSGNGSEVVINGEELTLHGVVNGGLMYWSVLDGGASAVNITIADLVFNPAISQTFASSATYQSYTQSGVINFTADLAGAVNGVNKVYQIVGNGNNIVFNSNCVNSDDGVTLVGTINKTGTFTINTGYDASINKIRVDIPIFQSAPLDLNPTPEIWPVNNTITSDLNRHYQQTTVDGVVLNVLGDATNAENWNAFLGDYNIINGGSVVFSAHFALTKDQISPVPAIATDGVWAVYGYWNSVKNKAIVSVPGLATSVDVTAPLVSSAEVGTIDATSLIITFNEALDPASVPAVGDWNVLFNAVANIVTNVVVSSNTVDLTLTNAITIGATVTVDYTSGVNPLQDLATVPNEVVDFINQPVTNNLADITAPIWTTGSFEIGNVNDTTVVLPVNEPLDTGSPFEIPGSFTIQYQAVNQTINSIDLGTANQVRLIMAAAPAFGDAIAAFYTASGNPIRDLADLPAPNLPETFVANNIAGSSITPTLIQAGRFNNTEIALTYGFTVDAASIPATTAFVVAGVASSVTVTNVELIGTNIINVRIGGVILKTDTPTIAYTIPGANPIQEDGTGIDADSFTATAATDHYSLEARSFYKLEFITSDWLEATATGRVSQLNDRKGSIDFDSNGATADEPQLDAGVLVSGKNMMRGYNTVFTGNNEYRSVQSDATDELASYSAFKGLHDGNDFTLFFVVHIPEMGAATGNRYPIFNETGGATNGGIFFTINNDNDIWTVVTTSAGTRPIQSTGNTLSPVLTAGEHMCYWRYDSASTNYFFGIDGQDFTVARASADFDTGNHKPTNFLRNNQAAHSFGECMFFDQALLGTDFTDVLDDLKTEWGLTF